GAPAGESDRAGLPVLGRAGTAGRCPGRRAASAVARATHQLATPPTDRSDYASAPMATETTLVLVKPDGVRRALCGEIVARFERRGYELRGARLLKVSRALAQQHYAEHKGKP